MWLVHFYGTKKKLTAVADRLERDGWDTTGVVWSGYLAEERGDTGHAVGVLEPVPQADVASLTELADRLDVKIEIDPWKESKS